MSFKSGFITFKRGETKNFDIDHDGKDDIAVTVESVTLNRATLLLERINSDVGPSKAEKRRQAVKQTLPHHPNYHKHQKLLRKLKKKQIKLELLHQKNQDFSMQ